MLQQRGFRKSSFKVLLIALIASLIGTTIISCGEAAPPEVIELTMTSNLPGPTGAYSGGMVLWAQEIEKRTNGQVKVTQMTWGGALLKSDTIVQGIGQGIADIGFYSTDYVPSVMPVTRAVSPTMYDDGRSLDTIQAQIYQEFPEIRAEFDKMNIVPLFFYSGSCGVLQTNFTFNSLEELKGKKIRAVGQSNDMVANLGAVPVNIAAGDTYTAMQKGTIDGVSGLPPSTLTTYKLSEVVKQVTDYRFTCYSTMFGAAINKDKYDKLPASVKKIITEIAPTIWEYFVKTNDNDAFTGLELAQKAGARIVQLSPEEAKRWRDIVNPESIWEKYIKVAEDAGSKTVRSALAKELKLMDEYNAKNPRKTLIERFLAGERASQ